jgi:hypothetical protein
VAVRVAVLPLGPMEEVVVVDCATRVDAHNARAAMASTETLTFIEISLGLKFGRLLAVPTDLTNLSMKRKSCAEV